MSTKPSVLDRAVKAVKKGMAPQQYGVHGKPFVCVLCGHDRFTVGGTGVSVVSLHTLVCVECSHIEFFAKQPPVI